MSTTVSQMTSYRKVHPDYYEAEKVKNRERNIKAYHEDPDRKAKVLEYRRNLRTDPEYRKKEAEYKKAWYVKKKALAKVPVEL